MDASFQSFISYPALLNMFHSGCHFGLPILDDVEALLLVTATNWELLRLKQPWSHVVMETLKHTQTGEFDSQYNKDRPAVSYQKRQAGRWGWGLCSQCPLADHSVTLAIRGKEWQKGPKQWQMLMEPSTHNSLLTGTATSSKFIPLTCYLSEVHHHFSHRQAASISRGEWVFFVLELMHFHIMCLNVRNSIRMITRKRNDLRNWRPGKRGTV